MFLIMKQTARTISVVYLRLYYIYIFIMIKAVKTTHELLFFFIVNNWYNNMQSFIETTTINWKYQK